MAKSRGRKFAEITTPTNGVFDIASVPTITNAKLQNSAMTLAGSSVSLGGTGVANTDALSEGSSNVYFTDARVQTFLGGGTLAGNVVVPDNRSIYLGSDSDFRMVHNTTNTQLINATGQLQITSNGGFAVTGAATFSSNITGGGYIQASGNISTGGAGKLRAGASNETQLYFDGSHGHLDNSTGNFTVDVVGNINLDTDTGVIYLQDAGTFWGQINRATNDWEFYSPISDGDIVFKGNDGGSTVTALTLDMSDGGNAIFSGSVGIGNPSPNRQLSLKHASQAEIGFKTGSVSNGALIYYNDSEGKLLLRAQETSDRIEFQTGGITERMRIDSSGDVRFAANATGAALIKGISGDQVDRNSGGYPQFTFVGNEGTGMRRVSSNVLAFDNSGDESMRIDSNGKVGIGTAPAKVFHIKETGSTSAVNEFVRIENSASGGAAAGSSINFHHYHAGGGPAGGAKAASITAQNMDSWAAGTPSGYSSGLTFGTIHANTFDERMRITSDGKVGIGTPSPTEKLHVEGSLLLNVADSGIGEEGIFFRSGFSSSNKYNVSITNYAHDGAGNFSDGISINGYDGVSICTGSNTRQERMRIVGGTGTTSGNVGINELNPSGKLHITDGNNYAKFGDFHSNSTMTLQMADSAGFPVEMQAYSSELRFNTTPSSGATPVNRMHIQNDGHIRVNPGAADYDSHTNVDQHLFTVQTSYNANGDQNLNIVNHNGNWIDGTSGSDTAYGLMWGYQNSIRAGIHYDHRGQEKFDFYSSYAPIRFRLRSVNGNTSPIGSESTMPVKLELYESGIGIDNPSAIRSDTTFTGATGHATKRWGFGAGRSASSAPYYVLNESNAGNYVIYGESQWRAHSDERIKENITSVGTVLPSLMNMRCAKYNLKSNPGNTKIGFIAQDWENNFPEVVDENSEMVLESDGSVGMAHSSESTIPVKGMAYTETIPLLLKAIQEQQALIETLQTEVAALKG